MVMSYQNIFPVTKINPFAPNALFLYPPKLSDTETIMES